MTLKFDYVDTKARPYLYVTRKCSMDPQAVSQTMGQAFSDVMSFMQSNDIRPSGPALSVYYTYDSKEVEFRAGFFVTSDDAARASGQVQAGLTPAASHVLSYTHVGPYEGLRDSYDQMMQYLEKQGEKVGAPTWEIYVDDPDSTPAEKMRTDIFVVLA